MTDQFEYKDGAEWSEELFNDKTLKLWKDKSSELFAAHSEEVARDYFEKSPLLLCLFVRFVGTPADIDDRLKAALKSMYHKGRAVLSSEENTAVTKGLSILYSRLEDLLDRSMWAVHQILEQGYYFDTKEGVFKETKGPGKQGRHRHFFSIIVEELYEECQEPGEPMKNTKEVREEIADALRGLFMESELDTNEKGKLSGVIDRYINRLPAR